MRKVVVTLCTAPWETAVIRWQGRRSRRAKRHRGRSEQTTGCRWRLGKNVFKVHWVRQWQVIPVHTWTACACAVDVWVSLGEEPAARLTSFLHYEEMTGRGLSLKWHWNNAQVWLPCCHYWTTLATQIQAQSLSWKTEWKYMFYSLLVVF